MKPSRLELVNVNANGGQPLRLAGGGRKARPFVNPFATVSWCISSLKFERLFEITTSIGIANHAKRASRAAPERTSPRSSAASASSNALRATEPLRLHVARADRSTATAPATARTIAGERRRGGVVTGSSLS